MAEKVKISKGNIVKYVDKKDVADYVIAGWKVVKGNSNPFEAYGINKK